MQLVPSRYLISVEQSKRGDQLSNPQSYLYFNKSTNQKAQILTGNTQPAVANNCSEHLRWSRIHAEESTTSHGQQTNLSLNSLSSTLNISLVKVYAYNHNDRLHLRFDVPFALSSLLCPHPRLHIPSLAPLTSTKTEPGSAACNQRRAPYSKCTTIQTPTRSIKAYSWAARSCKISDLCCLAGGHSRPKIRTTTTSGQMLCGQRLVRLLERKTLLYSFLCKFRFR